MGYVDFILNLAGLLLWLNWRSIRFDPLVKRTPATLMGTLRPAAPKKLRRWHLLVLLAGCCCCGRCLPVDRRRSGSGSWIWTVMAPPFRSDWFLRMLAIFLFEFRPGAGNFLCRVFCFCRSGPGRSRFMGW